MGTSTFRAGEETVGEGERPKVATVAILLMVATGFAGIALGVYFAGWGGNLFAGLLLFFLGIAYAYGGRGLYQGESWGWGAGVFAGAFYVLLGIFLLPLAAVTLVPAVVVIVLLFRVREYYGMVRYDEDAEVQKRDDLRAERTANPNVVHCPRCGSTSLWIAPDGSAYCENCKTGIISVKPAA